jgi:7-keto-8-aminopelargonate synthetase-like enzyme
MKISEFPNRIIEINQEEYLYFGGTAYLGLAKTKKFQQIITRNIQKWGTSYGSSRNANIQLTAYDKAENYLANLIQAEKAVTVSSGSLAGKLVIEKLAEYNVTFFHLPNHHNAIQAKNSLPVWVNNNLNTRLLDGIAEKIVILTDAVPTDTIQPIDLSFINLISKEKEITLVIDESHSLGILGANGCGIYGSINHKNIARKVMISSLGKGLALTGGVVASDATFIEHIKNMGNFVSAAGMNPAFAASIPESEFLFNSQLKKLRSNLDFINKNLLVSAKYSFNSQYPIIYPKNKDAFEILKSEGIIITNFKYPNDNGFLNRIIITANHQKKDLKKLISILNMLPS